MTARVITGSKQEIAQKVASLEADVRQAITATGAFALPDNSLDAAILVSLEPGVYTAHATSATSSTGVALIEIYEAP